MKFINLLRETQFHGGRRLADPLLRIWWVIGLSLLFLSAVCVVVMTVQRFVYSPTYLAHEGKMDTSRLFPSVLICPAILFPQRRVEKFFDEMKIPRNLSRDDLHRTVNQLAAFYSPDADYRVQDLENLHQLIEFNNLSLYDAGLLLTASCEETLFRCRWIGVIINCSELFQMELTADGFCCVFNGKSLRRAKEDHSKEKEYRTGFSGLFSGLTLALNYSQLMPINVDLEYIWLGLQSSKHFVESTNNGTPLALGMEHWAVYHVRRNRVHAAGRVFSDELRRCRARDYPLRYFPLYHKRYCVVECEIEYSMKNCNCVRPVYPAPRRGQYCRAHRLACAYEAIQSYGNDACGCVDACDVEVNFVEKSSYPLSSAVRIVDNFYDGLDYQKVTVVRTYLQNRKLKTKSRRFQLTILDLFSQLGGVFNVFLGCSVLTLLELAILGIHAMRYRSPSKSPLIK